MCWQDRENDTLQRLALPPIRSAQAVNAAECLRFAGIFISYKLSSSPSEPVKPLVQLTAWKVFAPERRSPEIKSQMLCAVKWLQCTVMAAGK